jgi:hypothetical protein
MTFLNIAILHLAAAKQTRATPKRDLTRGTIPHARKDTCKLPSVCLGGGQGGSVRLSRVLVTVAVLVAAAIPSHAPAQVESTPIPAPQKPNFSSMSFLVGTWTCSTKSSRRPAAYVATLAYSMDPTGYWLNQTSTVHPLSWMSRRLTTWDKITYDSDTKRWVDVAYDEQGDYSLSVASGWNGDNIAWHDLSFVPGPQISAQSDTTNTKESATKYTTSMSFTEANTGRKVTVNGVCTKHA